MNRRPNFIEDVHSIYTLKGSKAFQGFEINRTLFEGADTNIYKKTNEFSKMLQNEMNKVEETFNFLFVANSRISNTLKITQSDVIIFLISFRMLTKTKILPLC